MEKDYTWDRGILGWNQYELESVPRFERTELMEKKARKEYLTGNLARAMHYLALLNHTAQRGFQRDNVEELTHYLRGRVGKEAVRGWGKNEKRERIDWEEFDEQLSLYQDGSGEGPIRKYSLEKAFSHFFNLTPQEAHEAKQNRERSQNPFIERNSWVFKR